MSVQHLYKTIQEQLERLNDPNMTPEKMKLEIEKSKAISELGQVLINASKAENEFNKIANAKKSIFFKEQKMLEIDAAPVSNIVIPITAGGEGPKK